MELSHSLTLNETALNQLPEAKRPVFILEWLRFLDKVLAAAHKADIKECQQRLVEQLTARLHDSPGPPARRLIARCLATLFSVGDTFLLFDTVNKCNDILKNRDDSPSFLPTRLAAICCLGWMYEKLGRMMGRSYEETLQILLRSLRSAESQTRTEIMATCEKICAGMGGAINNVHKEIYKATRYCMTDRVMAVRCAAAKCLLEMLNQAPFLYTTELESVASLCFRALDGSTYEVRCGVARLLGALVAKTQQSGVGGIEIGQTANSISKQAVGTKSVSLDDALNILMSGFLRGGSGAGFLKGTGEIIKGTSTVSREVRVGVTHAYVLLARTLGPSWLERHVSPWSSHLLELVASPKAAASHVDAVYSRKCVAHVLRATVGRMLGERAQLSACKELTLLLAKQMASLEVHPENAKESPETVHGQHVLVCGLQELGCLLLGLGTTAGSLFSDFTLGLINTVFATLVHPCQAARLAAAWCLRCATVAVPSYCTPLIERCVEGIDTMRSSPEAIAGYSGALAAVLGGVRLSPLGVPHTKGKVIFNTAEELLRSASQNSRLSLHRTQAGWLLIGAIMTLGGAVVRGLLPRMLLLWRNSFPRSTKELESEKARGDAFTWQVTLEGRAGALAAMHSLLQHCPELATEEVTRRLLTPIESALAMLINISSVLKSYGQHLKAPAAMVRLRLYETLSLLPAHTFEGSYTHLLRLLVAEFTLAENPANTTTSQLRAVCHADEALLLGACLRDPDHRAIEDQMEVTRKPEIDHLQGTSAAGSGALEHDPCCLYRPLHVKEQGVPGPLPLGVAVIDQSVILFGQIFPRVAAKHRLQMLTHFCECIRQAKSTRQEAVQLNVFTAVLAGLRGLAESKSGGGLGSEEVKKAAVTLIEGGLTHGSPALRCAAGEALGRLAQAVAEPRFTADQAQHSFDRLTTARDASSRTGHSLALGCLHKYVGSLGSSQHLNTSVSILLALAQDTASPVVQVWSLHALTLIADSGGPMFRGYVEPTLSLSLKLLLSVPLTHVDVHRSIAKGLAALITTLGPELQGNGSAICAARSSFLCACAILQEHEDPAVQAEATACLQQLHLFAPKHVNLATLVPALCRSLSSNHLVLRKAAVSCLRQLSQREAKEVCEHASSLAVEGKDSVEGLHMTESGLPGVLFGLLDVESDPSLVSHVHDTLASMLQVLAEDNLSQWLALCKDVLTVATESSVTDESGGDLGPSATDEDEDEDSDAAEFRANDDTRRPLLAPRWPTRVFAAQCVRRVIEMCVASPHSAAHFDLAKARQTHLTRSRGGDLLVLHLAELVRVAFMAATSDSDPLRLEGLRTLQEVIERFAKVPEPEFPGHLLLEQYQAQVGAALRPAFSPDTPPTVTAAACEVCSAWIGSGVARDLNDLRRVHQLLVSSLAKLRAPANSELLGGSAGTPKLYNESLTTLERLAILRAWAEVYIVAIGKSGDGGEGGLLALVQQELYNLSQHWMAALRDHALLSLPPEYASQLPHDGGAFYTSGTAEASRPYYARSWPPLLLAVALWLTRGGGLEALNSLSEAPTSSKEGTDPSADRFHLLFGICLQALCSTRTSEPLASISTCVRALSTLLSSSRARSLLVTSSSCSLGVELCNVLHRLVLTWDNPELQLQVMEALNLALQAGREQLEATRKRKLRELVPANQEHDAEGLPELAALGEGGETGELEPGKSLVFAALEVCLCMLVRQLPVLNPMAGKSAVLLPPAHRQGTSTQLVAAAVNALEALPPLCSPAGILTALPTLLYLVTGVLGETAAHQNEGGATSEAVGAALRCLRSLAAAPLSRQDSPEGQQYRKLLQSALGKLLDLAKTSGPEQPDDATVLLGIAVFALHAPSEVACTPALLYPSVNHCKRCLQSSTLSVRVQCVQTLRAVFQTTEKAVAGAYVHALAPRLVEMLYRLTGAATPQRHQPVDDNEVPIVLEGLKTLETLVSLAEPQHRMQLLNLLVPLLVACLREDSAGLSKRKSLHDYSLSWLMRVAPQYPQEFKILMRQWPELRTRVQNAVRGNTTTNVTTATTNNINSTQNSQQTSQLRISTQQAPSIQLKTDFSNFAKSAKS